MSNSKIGKKKKWKVSPVGQTFGANAENFHRSAESFLKAVVPRSWKPKLIGGDIWEETKASSYGYMHYVVELRDFPYLSHFTSKEHELPQIKTYKKIRNILWDWVFKTKGMKYPAPNGGGVGFGCGQWFLNYHLKDFEGTFLAWIIPQGKRKATLIAQITEARITPA